MPGPSYHAYYQARRFLESGPQGIRADLHERVGPCRQQRQAHRLCKHSTDNCGCATTEWTRSARSQFILLIITPNLLSAELLRCQTHKAAVAAAAASASSRPRWHRRRRRPPPAAEIRAAGPGEAIRPCTHHRCDARCCLLQRLRPGRRNRAASQG